MDRPDYLLGIHNFKGRSDDEIDIARGDFIEVIEDDSAFQDSWYIGRNLRTNATGLFPKVFTTAAPTLPEEVAKLDSARHAAAPASSLAFSPPPVPTESPLAPESSETVTLSPQNAAYAPANMLPVTPPPLHSGDLSRDSQVSAVSAISDLVGQSDLDAAISEMTRPIEPRVAQPQATPPSAPSSVAYFGGHFAASPAQHAPMPAMQTTQTLVPHSTPPIQSALQATALNHHSPPHGSSVVASPPSAQPSSYAHSLANFHIDNSVRNWTASDVAAYLARNGFHDEAPLFVKHRITGAILLEMDRDTLKEIGITSFGPRFEIDKLIRQFRRELGFEVAEDRTSPESQHSAFSPTPGFTPPPAVESASATVHAKPSLRSLNNAYVYEYAPSLLNSPTNSQRVHSPQSFEFATRFSPRIEDPGRFDFSPGSDEYRSSHDRNPSSTTTSSAPTSQRFKEKYEPDLKRSATEKRAAVPLVRASSVSARSVRSADSRKHRHRASVLSVLSTHSPRKESERPRSPERARSPAAEPLGSGALVSHALVAGSNNSSAGTSGTSHTSATSASADTYADEISAKEQAARSKRSTTDSTLKSLMRPGLTKQKTSAFQEGIKRVSAQDAKDTAEKAGWMLKRGNTALSKWSKRYFTLHGTRLSYFENFSDNREHGLIDITGHRVAPVKDKSSLLKLATQGLSPGKHCFKIIPPGPGYKKGVSFTEPKVHYFAVDSEEEMRSWLAALTTATIERDESKPVLSTCKIPAMSLPRAQELMAERLATKGEIGSLTKD